MPRHAVSCDGLLACLLGNGTGPRKQSRPRETLRPALSTQVQSTRSGAASMVCRGRSANVQTLLGPLGLMANSISGALDACTRCGRGFALPSSTPSRCLEACLLPRQRSCRSSCQIRRRPPRLRRRPPQSRRCGAPTPGLCDLPPLQHPPPPWRETLVAGSSCTSAPRTSARCATPHPCGGAEAVAKAVAALVAAAAFLGALPLPAWAPRAPAPARPRSQP